MFNVCGVRYVCCVIPAKLWSDRFGADRIWENWYNIGLLFIITTDHREYLHISFITVFNIYVHDNQMTINLIWDADQTFYRTFQWSFPNYNYNCLTTAGLS